MGSITGRNVPEVHIHHRISHSHNYRSTAIPVDNIVEAEAMDNCIRREIHKILVQ
jgi:hypothetical protein